MEVLADRDDIDAVPSQVPQGLDHLVVRLAQPDDDAGLAQHRVAGDVLRSLQQPERLAVRCLRAAHARVQPPHGLDVVVEHVGALGEHDLERLFLVAEEVRRQYLDGRLGHLVLQCTNGRGVVTGALVEEIVAVDRRDDHVGQPHLRRGLGEAQRLERVGRCVRPAGMDVAVAAGSRARVAEDLEGGRAATPALRDVRAARFLADRVQALSVDQLPHLEVARVAARRPHLHPLGPPGSVSDWA